MRFLREQKDEDLSERQEWLWDQVVRELEYRNRHRRPGDRCTCELCWSPFDAAP